MIEFYHPEMKSCTNSYSTSITYGGTISTLINCVIPGPIYYTEYLSVFATATSSKGAYGSNTKSFTLKIG